MAAEAPTPQGPVPDLRRYLFETVLPFWADTGIDKEKGGFVERLTRDRKPAPDDYKRLRVQARQIYSYCHAHLLGAGDWTLGPAREGYRFMTRRGQAPQGGWYHLTTRAGKPLDEKRDAYDHAFVLFALAWMHKATGDREPLALARRTIAFMDEQMADPHGRDGLWGGYHEHVVEGMMSIPLPRRQNPHMHLLEALLALHDATGEAEWAERAAWIVDLFKAAFYDAETGSLGEYFTADWHPAPGDEGSLREPGHHFEWVWLLHRYRAQTGDDSVLEPAERLYSFGLAGVDAEPGMVLAPFDETGRDGAVRSSSKRLWVQTEAIKAFVARAEFHDDADAAERARAHLASFFSSHLDPESPVWRDQLDRGGEEISRHIPASSLYHLFLCLAEVMRVLGDRADGGPAGPGA